MTVTSLTTVPAASTTSSTSTIITKVDIPVHYKDEPSHISNKSKLSPVVAVALRQLNHIHKK